MHANECSAEDDDYRFELSPDLPVPVSVGQRDGVVVIYLREGAVVDAALAQALNDLLRRPGGESP